MSEIPPTEVGGTFRSFLQKIASTKPRNPTNGRDSYENRIALNQIDDSRSIFIRSGESKIHDLLCQNSDYCQFLVGVGSCNFVDRLLRSEKSDPRNHTK